MKTARDTATMTVFTVSNFTNIITVPLFQWSPYFFNFIFAKICYFCCGTHIFAILHFLLMQLLLIPFTYYSYFPKGSPAIIRKPWPSGCCDLLLSPLESSFFLHNSSVRKVNRGPQLRHPIFYQFKQTYLHQTSDILQKLLSPASDAGNLL